MIVIKKKPSRKHCKHGRQDVVRMGSQNNIYIDN